MSVALKLTLGLLLATAPVATSAQALTDIKFGQTLTKKVGTKTDIYRFVGGSGTTIKATLTAPGKAALILYTPAGEEMLTAQGNGSVTLEAILPLAEMFSIAVLRKDGAKPYALKLNGVEPDAHLALWAHRSGFAVEHEDKDGPYFSSTCWIEPGVKIRRMWPKGVEEITLGRGGKEFATWKTKNGKSGAAEREVRFDGPNVIFHRTDGTQPDQTRSFEKLFELDGLDKYQSYLCEPKS